MLFSLVSLDRLFAFEYFNQDEPVAPRPQRVLLYENNNNNNDDDDASS